MGGEGGSPPLSLTTSICENFDPFLSFIKRQNNPKYGNLLRNFHIYLILRGRGGGVNPSGQPDRFSQFFFEPFPKGGILNDDDDSDGNKNHQQQLLMIVKRVVLQKVQTEMVMDWDDDGEYFDSDDANNDNDADNDADDDARRAA